MKARAMQKALAARPRPINDAHMKEEEEKKAGENSGRLYARDESARDGKTERRERVECRGGNITSAVWVVLKLRTVFWQVVGTLMLDFCTLG